MNPIPCSVCQESGHHAAKCPTLSDPLKQGFYTGGGGGHAHGGDEEERLKLPIHTMKRCQHHQSKSQQKCTKILP